MFVIHKLLDDEVASRSQKPPDGRAKVAGPVLLGEES
jgi:hypothetical protein